MTNSETVITYNVTDAGIEELRQQFGKVETVWNNAELALLKADITVVRTLRTSVEATRKGLKKEALEYGRKVDTEAKRITAELLTIEEPMKAEQARFEAIAENERLELARIDAERIAKIQVKIDEQAALPLALMGKPAEEIAAVIKALESPDDFDYQELSGAHAVAVMASLPALRQMHSLEVQRVANMEAAAEQERLAVVERERLEGEREAFAAEQRIRDGEASRERVEAEAERKRLADIAEKQLAREREDLDRERRQIEADKQEAKEAREKEEREKEAEAKKAKRSMIVCPHCKKKFEAPK